jgi:membrane-bound inhibitor of C-type lysozyme
MKQTAVDFLSEKYMYVTWLRNRDEISSEQADKMRAQYLAKAKEMEKEQIKDAYKCGACDLDIQYSDVGEINSEQYYNETHRDDT